MVQLGGVYVHGVAKVGVADPLRAVAATDAHEHEGLGGARLARGHAFGGDGVGRDVVGVREEVHDLVDDLGAVTVRRRGDVGEAQLGQRLLHVGGRARTGLVVVALRVRDGGEHGAGSGELVVVGVRISEEPVVVPQHLRGDVLVCGRGHARVVHRGREAARAVRGVVDVLERGGGVHGAHAAALHREAPLHDAVQPRHHGENGQERDEGRDLGPAVARREAKAEALRGGRGAAGAVCALGLAQADPPDLLACTSPDGSAPPDFKHTVDHG